MLKYVINGRFLIHRITGVERYARELVRELDSYFKPGEAVMAVPPETTDIPEYKNIEVKRIGRLSNRLWEHISFPRYVKSTGALSISLCNVAPLVRPDIVCIHDVKVLAHPEYFNFRFRAWYRLLIGNETRRAVKILTVSDFSARELVRLTGVNKDKIEIIYNAWQHLGRTGFDEETLNRYGLTAGGYFFTISSLEPNKNFNWIRQAAAANPGSIFAVAGSVNREVFSSRNASGNGDNDLPGNIRLLGYVTDEEARTLMRDCSAFLFPSFYEGFGIPPLEALAAGAPQIIISDTDVMHEIYGQGPVYINPDDGNVDLAAEPMDDRLRQEILEKYSWKKSAQKLYDILETLQH